MMGPSVKSTKKPLERHHLFPKAWREAQGETEHKVINQLAYFALIELPENIAIDHNPPPAYVPELCRRFIAEYGSIPSYRRRNRLESPLRVMTRK